MDMAPSIYDEHFLTDEEKKAIADFGRAYMEAQSRGDHAGMDSAHAAAERLRAGHGYSGGGDGSAYMELAAPPESRSSERTYVPQTDAVNSVYDAAKKARLAGLKSAFDANVLALQAKREAVPELYDGRKNDLAAQAEAAQRGFDEYAAAAGLSSGAAGQARLARSNTLQAGLSALGREEARALRDIDSDEAALKLKYQDDIARAVAEGEYERAAALLEEYRKAAQSAVSAARA